MTSRSEDITLFRHLPRFSSGGFDFHPLALELAATRRVTLSSESDLGEYRELEKSKPVLKSAQRDLFKSVFRLF